MTCKHEKVETNINLRHNSYKCTKYGFNSGLRCTKLNQPNCYKVEKEEKELKNRASKLFTNPGDALIAFRELIKIKEEVKNID